MPDTSQGAIVGYLQGVVEGLNNSIAALSKNFSDTTARIEATLERQNQALDKQGLALKLEIAEAMHRFKDESDTGFASLQGQLTQQRSEIDALRQHQANADGRAAQSAKTGALFRWVMSLIIALLTLVFGEHMVTWKGK